MIIDCDDKDKHFTRKNNTVQMEQYATAIMEKKTLLQMTDNRNDRVAKQR